MADKAVWLITGAGRGMGVDITKAAFDAGHAVVATGRSTEAVADAYRRAGILLRLRRLEVRARGMDGVAALRG
jgi:NADP-dependent 3-hydroxy acid dehydrogenase YdfG